MSHFRTIILRNTLIFIGIILFMAGCEPESLLDDSPSDVNHSQESDAAWDEDSWWDQDIAANKDAANNEDKDTEVSGEEDIDDLPNADHPDFLVVADTLRNSCGTSGCHGTAAQGNFAIQGGMDATNSQVRSALENIEAQNGEMLIEPGDVELSEIYLRLITTDRSESMPPAPFPALDQDKIDEIHDWIASGAPYE